MTSVGVSAPGMESFLCALVTAMTAGMKAGADHELRAGFDGGFSLVGSGYGAGAEQQLRSRIRA
jgi:hypothetical protein